MAHRARNFGAALLLVALVAADARADEYLEDEHGRGGLMIGFSFGGALAAGRGDLTDILQLGGTFGLRAGVAAGERMLWMVQIDILAYAYEEPLGMELVPHAMSLTTVAGQYYVREAFWIKGGFGLAGLSHRASGTGQDRSLASGAGGHLSLCGEVARRGRFAFGIEGIGGLGVFADGVLGFGAVRLGFNWY